MIFRVIEILLCSILLFFFFPVFIISCIIIVIVSGKSPLIAHLRVGQHKKNLWIYKIRTLWNEATSYKDYKPIIEYIICEEKDKNNDPKKDGCEFSKLLRRSSLDELPQLIQVIRGQMSLVGPRPITKTEINLYYQDVSDELLSIKPGITGLWQVKKRSTLSYNQRKKYDLFYIRCQKKSLLNTIIIFNTMLSMIGLEGS